MAGIFPAPADGGIPPNPADPNNPAAAYLPTTLPVDTSALYYGNDCGVRLRPEVLNSILSELEATVDQGEVPYRAGSRENLEQAVRYLIQRGLARGALATTVTPDNYAVTLDPVATRYNDFMTLCLVPDYDNIGPVTIDVNALGPKPVKRMDGQPVGPGDLRAFTPSYVAYYADSWWLMYIVPSQIRDVDDIPEAWVRTDGNDATADGLDNTAASAFRTIQAAYDKLVLGRYSTPPALFNIKLGMDGTYESAIIGPDTTRVMISGAGGSDRSAYHIAMRTTPGNYGAVSCIYVTKTVCSFKDLTFDFQRSQVPSSRWCIWATAGATVLVKDVDWNVLDSVLPPPPPPMPPGAQDGFGGGAVLVAYGSSFCFAGGASEIHGNSVWWDCPFWVTKNSNLFSLPGTIALNAHDLRSLFAFAVVDEGSTFDIGARITSSNCFGRRFIVGTHSLLHLRLNRYPGTRFGAVTKRHGRLMLY